jgi:hypothetical protein
LFVTYDGEYRRAHPQITISVQREIEGLYQQLYSYVPDNIEEITAVCIGMCDDSARYAYEAGIRCGVRLALDLELERSMKGGD